MTTMQGSNPNHNSNNPNNGQEESKPLMVKAENEKGTAWHQTYVMDAWGDARGSAMARLVSIPVSLAVQAARAGAIAPGVHAAPSDLQLVANWMDEVSRLAQHLAIVDHVG